MSLTIEALFVMGRKMTINDILKEGETYADIPGYEGKYKITSHGRVISTQRGVPRVLSAWEHATSKSVVELRAPDGSTRILSTEKLRKEAFDTYTTADSKIYDYIEDVYGDDPEAREWLEGVLEDEIDRRD